MARAGALVKRFPNGKWYYRLGSSRKYPWHGPFETKHVATKVREGKTGGAWGMPQASRRRYGDMRANIEKVLHAFGAGSSAVGDSGRTCSTDGTTLYSYRMPIARRVGGRIYIVPYHMAPSATTRSQVRAAQVYFHGKYTESATLGEGHASRYRHSRYGNDGAAPPSAPAAADKRRRKGACVVCGGAHSWKSCPHHHGDKRGRGHTKRNARTGRFTRRR